MNRVNVFVRRQRIKKLDKWTMRAIIAEGFFIALFPSLAAAAVLFGTVTWFLRLQIDTKFKFRTLPFDVPAALFALISAISVFSSSARSFPLIYHYFAFVGIYGLTYILIGQNIRTREQVKTLVKALAASALLVVLYGYFQYIFGIDTADMKWVDPEKFPELRNRVFSTLENPNVLAGYLDIFICLALGVLAKVSGRTQKLAMIIAIVMLSTCLAMTYARGAYLTIVAVFIIYGIIQDWRILVFFIVVTAGLLYYDHSFVERLTSIFELTDSSQGLRVGIWVSTIAMIADHPFIGIGWGAYKYVYPHYDYYIKNADVIIYHAHNIYLNYAAEIGIVGAMSFFWCFFGTASMTLNLGTNEKFNAIKEKVLELVGRITGIEVKAHLLKFTNEAKNKYLIENGRLEKFIGYKEFVTNKIADLSEKFMNWISFSQNSEEVEETPKVSLVKKSEADTDISEAVNVKTYSTSTTYTSKTTYTTVSKSFSTTATYTTKTVTYATSKPAETKTVEPIDLDNIDESKYFILHKDNENEKSKSNVTKITDFKDETDYNDIDEESADKPMFDWNEVSAINNQQIAEGVKFGIGLAFVSIALNGLTDDLLFNIPTSMLLWLLTALGAAIESLPEEETPKARRYRKN